MTYSMIERKRNAWFAAPDCPAKYLVDYIIRKGCMRDAQIDAIKTYLYLKIAHRCRPLHELYSEGAFNSLDIDALEVSAAFRTAMSSNPGLASLYEYLSDENLVASGLIKDIKRHYQEIDTRQVFRDIFYGVTYTDYIFSLPMGAGKTYLMAAFIYLDLYFSRMDPANDSFASNFVIFAPSGLKSSVVPSLKTIKEFDPSWVIPEPAASELKAMLAFEVLDEQKSENKSNQAKNPNVQKVAIHQPFETLCGLVLVTNAEKVILNKVQTDDNGLIRIISDVELDDAGRIENELRDIIGKLPRLGIFIDEVHHAQNDNIKLRAVVSRWATTTSNVNCVLGFSGTPYLEKKSRVRVTGYTSFQSGFMANVVNFYPLAEGIGNFLKKPTVKIVDGTSHEIVRAGIERFLDEYGDKTYSNGWLPKIAIFCGSVIKLEEEIYPLVIQILIDRGLDPDRLVLKYHRGGSGAKTFSTSPEWDVQFGALDSTISTKQIILLAQIGKEGWDCRSLAGVVLSQEGDCPKTMVLQTSCRCLREVIHGNQETALIYLNKSNAKILKKQLKDTQHIDLRTFQEGRSDEGVVRHSRLKRLKLPKIEHVRFELAREVKENTLTLEDIANRIRKIVDESSVRITMETVSGLDFSGNHSTYGTYIFAENKRVPATFRKWKHDLLHEAGIVPDSLAEFVQADGKVGPLRELFESLTYDEDGIRYYSPEYDQIKARSLVRSLFYPRREVIIDIEQVKEIACASLVDEERLVPIYGIGRDEFFPDEVEETSILESDEGRMPEDIQAAYDALITSGNADLAETLRSNRLQPKAMTTYQYIPYRFDSPFEHNFYQLVMGLDVINSLGLEVYYNGDNSVADFRIDCFKKSGSMWKKVGKYTPDFLVLRRTGNSIIKVLIIETKGLGYSREQGFVDRSRFMRDMFVPRNEKYFGYPRFKYELFTDECTDEELVRDTERIIAEYFGDTKD